MINVRLTEKQLTAIINCFKKYFNHNDSLWLFGSRVNLTAKGGDIDLYLETDNQNIDELYQNKINFLCNLKQEIGDQRIDLVLNIKNSNKLLIYEIARDTGVKLV